MAVVVFQQAENWEKAPEMKHFCLLCETPGKTTARSREPLLTDRLALPNAPHEYEGLPAVVNWGPQCRDGFQCMYSFFRLFC